jgi:hypothetical protein
LEQPLLIMANKEVAFKIIVDTEQVFPEIENIKKEIEELRKANEKMAEDIKAGFKAAEQSTKGFGASIGGLLKSLGLIGVAMAVFEFMKDIVSKNQKVMDALSTATTALEIILYKVFDALEPLGDAMKAAFSDPKQAVLDLWETIKTNFVSRLEGVILAVEAAGKAIEASFNFDWDAASDAALDFGSALIQVGTGLDAEQQKAFLEGVKDFANEVGKATLAAVAQADALVRLRNEVKFLDVEQQRLQLTYQKDAEIQRQIRDDISRTLADRIAANDELKKVLDKQIAAEQIAVDKKIELAEAELALNTKSVDLQVALKQAKLAQAELDERITSQNSEQLTNQKSLEKELFDIQQELRVATLDARALELEDLDIYYEALAEKARLASDTTTDIEGAKNAAIAALKAKFLKEDLDKEKAATKLKIDMANKEKDARLAAASGIATGISSIVSALGNQSKASVAIQKTLAIAQIAIDTARSISSAIAAATASAAATGPGAVVATPVFIATQIATVLAAVGQAIGILNSAPGGGSASVPNVNVSATSAAPPSFNPVTTNTTDLGNTNQAELMPIQAFVVETQVTGSQNNINQIQGQAEFGGG